MKKYLLMIIIFISFFCFVANSFSLELKNSTVDYKVLNGEWQNEYSAIHLDFDTHVYRGMIMGKMVEANLKFVSQKGNEVYFSTNEKLARVIIIDNNTITIERSGRNNMTLEFTRVLSQ